MDSKQSGQHSCEILAFSRHVSPIREGKVFLHTGRSQTPQEMRQHQPTRNLAVPLACSLRDVEFCLMATKEILAFRVP